MHGDAQLLDLDLHTGESHEALRQLLRHTGSIGLNRTAPGWQKAIPGPRT